MRRFFSFGVAGAVGAMAACVASSCGSTEITCEDTATCAKATTGSDGGTAGSGGSGGGAGAAGAAGGDGATNETGRGDADAGCTSMLPPTESLCVNDSVALLVSSRGTDLGATGKRGAEFRTIGAALRAAAKGGPKRIYVCDDGTAYAETIAIDVGADAALDGVAIYGDFDCADWTYQATRRAKIAPASGPALSLKGATTGIRLVDLELVSANATGAGASSIAAIVDSSMNVVFERLKITAGAGTDGQPGVNGATGDDAMPVTPQQQGVAGMCPGGVTMQPGGAWFAPTTCGSKGGSGRRHGRQKRSRRRGRHAGRGELRLRHIRGWHLHGRPARRRWR
jgi:hypothetical protein